MNTIFLVFGYGIPKNILRDENYNFYLKTVFNKIYASTVKSRINKPIIITCGGKTDTLKPYQRTEAGEMIRFFSTMIQQKPCLKLITKNWLFIPEQESISTLENLLSSQKIILKHRIKKASLFIFCEQTREKRIKILTKKIFGTNYHFQVVPIDFDVSANRYLPLDFLAKKEDIELAHSLWALQSPENLKKHHKIFVEKIQYLRAAGSKTSVETVKKWWEQKLRELKS